MSGYGGVLTRCCCRARAILIAEKVSKNIRWFARLLYDCLGMSSLYIVRAAACSSRLSLALIYTCDSSFFTLRNRGNIWKIICFFLRNLYFFISTFGKSLHSFQNVSHILAKVTDHRCSIDTECLIAFPKEDSIYIYTYPCLVLQRHRIPSGTRRSDNTTTCSAHQCASIYIYIHTHISRRGQALRRAHEQLASIGQDDARTHGPLRVVLSGLINGFLSGGMMARDWPIGKTD